MADPIALKVAEDQAERRLCFDIAMSVGSVVLPGILPFYALADSTFSVINSDQKWTEQGSRIGFGLLATLPSFASGTFATRLYSKTIFRQLGKILTNPQFVTAYRLMTNPWISGGLLGLSGISSLTHYFQNRERVKKGEISTDTFFYQTLSDLTLLGFGMLFAFHRPNPGTKTTVSTTSDELTVTFDRPKSFRYQGTARVSWMKLKGLRRLLFYGAPRTLGDYHIKHGNYRHAFEDQLGFDDWMLRESGVHRVVIRGGEHLRKATEADRRAMTLQLTHYDLRDWALTDFASRRLGRDQGQLMKNTLQRIGPLDMLTTAELGSHLSYVNRGNIDRSVFLMQKGFRPHYPEREGGLHYLIYGPQTRTTGKNFMRDRGGVLVTRSSDGTLEVENVAAYGKDSLERLWRPHTTPFELALAHERSYGDNLHIVPSVIMPTDYQNGAFRTLVVEYFEPIPVRRYLELMRERRLDHKGASTHFRDDVVNWMLENLLKPGRFTSYADAYYPIRQSGTLGGRS